MVFRPAACLEPVLSPTIPEHLATTMEEPLARLMAFEPTTFPVLSVYLNTQPDQHGRAPDATPYLHREFKALSRTWAPSSPSVTASIKTWSESFPTSLTKSIPRPTELPYSRVGARRNSSKQSS